MGLFNLLCSLLLLTSTLLAAQVPGALPSDPAFEAASLSGEHIIGRVTSLTLSPDGAGSVVLSTAPQRPIAWKQLFRLGRIEASAASFEPGASLILLPGGDRLFAKVVSSDASALELASTVLSEKSFRVPLERVIGVVFNAPSLENRFGARVREIDSRDRKGEQVWLKNGDIQEGTLEAIDAKNLRLDVRGTPVSLERERVEAFASDPALIAYPLTAVPYCELVLTDGSRFGVLSCKLEGGRLSAETRFGARLSIAWKNVLDIYVSNGNVSLLSRREPTGIQYVPYLDGHPQILGRDTTWDGYAIRLGGRVTEHGLGMLPRTLAAYRIEPGDQKFQATIGLDDSSGEMANVVFRVLVDREERYVSPPLGARDTPIPIDISLGEGRLLVLVVEFGERGDVHDSAVWADARLIRAGVKAP